MKYIIGCDECGYGSWAGDLVVCGVRAQENWSIPGLNDSKKITRAGRERLYDKLMQEISKNNISYHIASRTSKEVDNLNVYIALKQCYVEIFHKLWQPNANIIVDGNLKFDKLGVDSYNIISEPKADAKYPVVMAASILGKVYRDRIMIELAKKYPGYGWEHNMGYHSIDHKEGIQKLGFSELHRKSYNIKV